MPHWIRKVEFEFSWFHNTQQSSDEILILKRNMLLEFQDKTNIEIIGFKLVHLGSGLVSSNIDLGNIYLLDKHLNFLYTDIPSRPFVCLQDALETSSRHILKTSSSHVLKTSWIRLQRNNFSSCKTSCEMSSRPLQGEKLLRWKHVEDVLKNNKCLLGKYKQYFLLKQIMLAHFQSLFRRSNRDAFWEN